MSSVVTWSELPICPSPDFSLCLLDEFLRHSMSQTCLEISPCCLLFAMRDWPSTSKPRAEKLRRSVHIGVGIKDRMAQDRGRSIWHWEEEHLKSLSLLKVYPPKVTREPKYSSVSKELLEVLRAKEDSLIIATGSAHPHQPQTPFLGNAHMSLFVASEALLLKTLCS